MNVPQDKFADVAERPEHVPVDFLPEIAEHNDLLSILIAAEEQGYFLFSEDNGPYANQY